MTEKKIIEMKKINKRYQKDAEILHILKNVSLDVLEGEFLAILGPSGSGKSTLMNMIGCMDVFDDGEYYLNGISIAGQGDKELTEIRNKEIGFVFQKYHLIPTYTVLQNIIMPLLMRGMSMEEARKESMDTIRLLGLDKRLKHKPSELSGGQQQRVAIARALVGEPTILLADEPTGALDTGSGKEVLKLFKKLNDIGHTIVMITHDMEVAKAAGRIVRIVDGELFEA
ncbi:MAG: ABC transporter ATP-binding protein [Lachnospiraceae bacterium]|nr:ABC transporter ATP-binding protein [Lachnospiraceae bacterium]